MSKLAACLSAIAIAILSGWSHADELPIVVTTNVDSPAWLGDLAAATVRAEVDRLAERDVGAGAGHAETTTVDIVARAGGGRASIIATMFDRDGRVVQRFENDGAVEDAFALADATAARVRDAVMTRSSRQHNAGGSGMVFLPNTKYGGGNYMGRGPLTMSGPPGTNGWSGNQSGPAGSEKYNTHQDGPVSTDLMVMRPQYGNHVRPTADNHDGSGPGRMRPDNANHARPPAERSRR